LLAAVWLCAWWPARSRLSRSDGLRDRLLEVRWRIEIAIRGDRLVGERLDAVPPATGCSAERGHRSHRPVLKEVQTCTNLPGVVAHRARFNGPSAPACSGRARSSSVPAFGALGQDSRLGGTTLFRRVQLCSGCAVEV